MGFFIFALKIKAAMEYQLESFSTNQARNILIIGKTGAGKASIANAVLGSYVFHVGTTIQSTTRRSDDTITVKEHQTGDYNYKISLVDTVGVRDDRQQNQQIQRRINEALKSFDSLSMIILVFKLERFSPQERESLQEAISVLKSRLVNASSITTLVVTCCEQKDYQAREEILRDLAMHGTETAEVVQFAQIGTTLVGLPKLSEVPPALKQFIEQRVTSDEQQLRELAKKASTMASVSSSLVERTWHNWLTRVCTII